MLLTIAQLQAVDFVLKINSTKTETKQQIAPVINYNGSLLTGDFVILDGYYYKESKISFPGHHSHKMYDYEDESMNQALPKIWSRYVDIAKNFTAVTVANDLAYLHHLLLKIVTESETQDSTSKLRPYWYNVKAVDKSFELPFLELSEEKLNLVSLVSIN